MLVVVGVISFIYDGVFQIFYTSVIRRMKAGVFWEYSFTNWVYVSTLRVLGTWKASVRVIVTFVFNALLFLFLAYQFFTRRTFVRWNSSGTSDYCYRCNLSPGCSTEAGNHEGNQTDYGRRFIL